MRALKFYDKEGTGFEFYVDYDKQSITMQLDAHETQDACLEIDEQDIDDIIISLVELKNEVVAIKNSSLN
jgi:catechol-2,3-dioxygenase